MSPLWNEILGIAMRWLHIVSVIVILGGFFYARFLAPPPVSRLRPILWTAMICVVISGIYNYLSKGVYPPGYHMWIGIKFLFVLHVFAAAVLYTVPSATEEKRTRRATGIVVSGAIIVLISGYLRWISLHFQS